MAYQRATPEQRGYWEYLDPFDVGGQIQQGIVQPFQKFVGGAIESLEPPLPTNEQITPEERQAFLQEAQQAVADGMLSQDQFQTLSARLQSGQFLDFPSALEELRADVDAGRVQQERMRVEQDYARIQPQVEQYRGEAIGALDQLQAHTQDDINRYNEIFRDPQRVLTDSEFAGAITATDNLAIGNERQAKTDGENRAAARGGGFSGAALRGQLEARDAGLNARVNARSQAFGQVGNARRGAIDSLVGMNNARNSINSGALDQELRLTGGRAGDISSLIGQQAGLRSDPQGSASNAYGTTLTNRGETAAGRAEQAGYFQGGINALQGATQQAANTATNLFPALRR